VGLSILTNEEQTEAVIVNDSVLPPQPLPIVFYLFDNEDGIVEVLNKFIDSFRPYGIRAFQGDLLKEWEMFKKELSNER